MPRKSKTSTAAAPPSEAEGIENINPELLPLARDVSTFRLDENNAKEHGEAGIRKIADSLATFGQQKPIVVSADGKVIAGNGTLQAARLLGWKRVAAVRSNLDSRKDVAFALADNRTAEASEWIYERLSTTLQEISAWEDGIVGKLGWDELELRPLLAADWTPPPVDGAAPEIRRRGEKDADEEDEKETRPRAPVGGMECIFDAVQRAEIEAAIERFVRLEPTRGTLQTFEEAIVAMCRTVAVEEKDE